MTRRDAWKRKEFDRLNSEQLTVPEWKVLLALAYDGQRNMFEISKAYHFAYPLVHRAVKGLVKLRCIEVVDVKRSEKNLKIKIYGLGREGLLWLLSRKPKTFPMELVDPQLEDSLGLRKTLNEKEAFHFQDLKTQRDVHLHLLFEFDMERIALNNTDLFPLVFNNWKSYNEKGIPNSKLSSLPENAFSTLAEYYHSSEDPGQKSESLERIFTRKVYRSLLESLIRAYPDGLSRFPKLIDSALQEATKTFNSSPELLKLFEHLCKEYESEAEQILASIKKVRSAVLGNIGTL
jgi:DNA-binding MarR family transcriptional regulator